MYRVLVPVDENENRARAQLDAVSSLAEEIEELQVDILYVYEEIDVPADEAGSAYINEINENLADIRDRPDTIALVREGLASTGANVEVHDTRGEASLAILEIAKEFDVDAIVLGTRRRTPVGKVLFGSVAQSVILESDRPVLMTPK